MAGASCHSLGVPDAMAWNPQRATTPGASLRRARCFGTASRPWQLGHVHGQYKGHTKAGSPAFGPAPGAPPALASPPRALGPPSRCSTRQRCQAPLRTGSLPWPLHPLLLSSRAWSPPLPLRCQTAGNAVSAAEQLHHLLGRR